MTDWGGKIYIDGRWVPFSCGCPYFADVVLIIPSSLVSVIKLLFERFPRLEWGLYAVAERVDMPVMEGYRIVKVRAPRQVIGRASVEYLEPRSAEENVLIHTHHFIGGFMSATDLEYLARCGFRFGVVHYVTQRTRYVNVSGYEIRVRDGVSHDFLAVMLRVLPCGYCVAGDVGVHVVNGDCVFAVGDDVVRSANEFIEKMDQMVKKRGRRRQRK